MISLGSRAPVVSTVKTRSPSFLVFVSTEILAEFHLACSVPRPSLAYASNLIRCPGAKYAIGILSEIGFTTSSFVKRSADVIVLGDFMSPESR